MHATADLSYSEYDGYEMVTLPYGSGAFALSVILPSEDVDFAVSASMFDVGVWTNLQNVSTTKQISVSIPEYSFEYDTSLAETLSALGVEEAFIKDKADFSGISDGDIWMSAFLHKTFIDVNREGTQAAATTSASMMGAMPQSFTVSRPFIFVISELSSGTILYIGQKVR